MKKQTKPESESLLRTPKPSKFGLKVRPIPMPHDDLIKAEVKPLELVTDEPIQPILSNDSPSYPIQAKKPTAPIKDYQRVPNSITRDAVPSGLFKGTSKSTYDALYLKTRGAINPVRMIKATKRELMKWIGISHVTMFKHLKHLESVGLIKIEERLGAHDGSIYEVFIPEEAEPVIAHTNPSNPMLSDTTHPTQSNDSLSDAIQSNNLVSLPYNNVVRDSMGNLIENKDTYGNVNTSLNTKTKIDDEPFGTMIEVLKTGVEKISGKASKKSDESKWKELGELLVMELEIAAARTNSVSNVPAFLTEHLRRRLLKAEATHILTGKKPMSDRLTKSSEKTEDAFEDTEPLNLKGRETVLSTMQAYVEKGQTEYVLGLERTFTKDDWDFLIENLQIGK